MRFVIFGDELLFSEALSSLLEQRGHVVASCRTSTDLLLGDVTASQPDVCLLDVHSAETEILPLLEQLRARGPRLPIVMLTGEFDVSLLWRFMEIADGLCVKFDGIDEIEEVVLRAVSARRSGEERPGIWSRGAMSLAKRAPKPAQGVRLTPKERAVLEHLVHGASTIRIAAELGVGEATVRTHLQHLFTKFGVHSRLALVACAVRAEAVSIGDRNAGVRN